MPIYEYVCTKCEEHHEAMQRISDPPLKKCPSCSGKLRKVVSSTSFVLKGSGWYKDGYATPQPSAKSESSSPTSADKAEKKESKTTTASDKKKAEPVAA